MAGENSDDFNEEKEAAEAEAAAKLEAEEKEEGNEEEKEEDKKGKEKEDEEDDPDEEIHTRKSKKDYIIERKDKKIAKLKEKEEEEKKGKEKEDEDDDDEDDAVFSKEDKVAIKKVVDKQNAPILEALKTQADKDEMKAVISKFPEAKAMEKRITKYSNHPAYQNVPMENIYLMLAGQNNSLQSKKEDAKKEDKKNETGGHTKRAKKGAEPDYANMSDEEIEETDKKLMTGQL